jgi:hypothetical protein
MYEVVASAVPDVALGEWGTPRQVAFTQAFIDRYVSRDEMGVMYAYRLPSPTWPWATGTPAGARRV